MERASTSVCVFAMYDFFAFALNLINLLNMLFSKFIVLIYIELVLAIGIEVQDGYLLPCLSYSKGSSPFPLLSFFIIRFLALCSLFS